MLSTTASKTIAALAFATFAGVLASACNGSDVVLGTQSSGDTAGATCKGAGGVCLPVGDDPCAIHASSGVDDCNPTRNPSGAFCCLEVDAGSATADSGKSAGSTCAAAGGTCLATGNAPCAAKAPSSDDDCNADLLPSGPFCCLEPGDAGGASSGSAGANCAAAGGTCLPIGDDPCAVPAAGSANDCNPALLPSGSFCCLSVGDAGNP